MIISVSYVLLVASSTSIHDSSDKVIQIIMTQLQNCFVLVAGPLCSQYGEYHFIN